VKFRGTLLDYQKDGVAFALERRYSLNGDEPGLGKTVQALALAARIQAERVLVLCPAHLRLNWKREIIKFLGKDELWRFQITSYDSIHKLLVFNFHLVIADEIHYVKSPSSQRTVKLTKLIAGLTPPDYFLGLSGTPIKNRVPEFWSPLKLCWLGKNFPEFDRYGNSHWDFCLDFTHKKFVKVGHRRFTKFDGVRNPVVLRDLIRRVYLKRRAKDVLSLPEQNRQVILAKDKDENDAALERAFDAYSEGKSLEADGISFSTAKAVNALAKVEFTRKFVESTLGQKKVLIWTDHVAAAKALAFEWDNVRVITGETPMALRNKYVDEFQNGTLERLVATIGSASTGLTLTSCSYAVFNDISFVPSDITQCEGRIHRIGQAQKTFYYFIMSSEMDHKIYRAIEEKRKIIETVGS
jgi:SWI/SNF-related matrix-associated actin-dependent regulator 1 of chromatin subfamily A